MRAIAVLLTVGASLAACGSAVPESEGGSYYTSAIPGASCAPGPTTGDLPCDVGAVLKASCQPCHQTPTQNGAHFPILTYEDTQKPFGLAPDDGGPPKRRFQRMAEVVQPEGLPHMPSQAAPACGGKSCSLSAADLTTLDAWFTACAPPAPEHKGCDVGE